MTKVRSATKSPILKGQNRGETEDKRIQKFEQLARDKRELGHGGPHETCNGFAHRTYQCLNCGTKNSLPLQTQAALTVGACETCGVETEQERVY